MRTYKENVVMIEEGDTLSVVDLNGNRLASFKEGYLAEVPKLVIYMERLLKLESPYQHVRPGFIGAYLDRLICGRRVMGPCGFDPHRADWGWRESNLSQLGKVRISGVDAICCPVFREIGWSRAPRNAALVREIGR